MNTDDITTILDRLDQIQATLQALVERQAVKDWYTTEEVAKALGKAEFTVREWCRLGRVRGEKKGSGRGRHQSWVISHEELQRIQREGLLPLPRLPMILRERPRITGTDHHLPDGGRLCDWNEGRTDTTASAILVSGLSALLPMRDVAESDAWEVQIRRPPRRSAHRHVARTLQEATKWAREHWRPDFLEMLMANVPLGHPAHALHREAVLGDPAAFLALLDAAEEAGVTVPRAALVRRARSEGMFVTELPETLDERRENEGIRRVLARLWANTLALTAHEHCPAGQRGFCDDYPQYRFVGYYVNHPFGCNLRLREQTLEAARTRLREEGVKTLAEASCSGGGDAVGTTAVILFDAATDHQRIRVRQVLDDAFREAG